MPSFSYNISVTGDCSNVGDGAILLSLNGGTPPYTVEFLSPITNVFTNVTDSVFVDNLSADDYSIRVNDSTIPQNFEYYLNIPLSNGVCAGIVSLTSTSCGESNGSVVISATSFYSSSNYALYDSDDNLIMSSNTNNSEYEFFLLSPGIYYSLVTDLGGCTGRTSDFIIEDSSDINFGLYTVPNTSCGGVPTGKIFVTGQTGIPPFSYLWNNGETTSSISGLTQGTYSVQVTDSGGCGKTKSSIVTTVSPIGLGLISVEQPQPFTNNGSITIVTTGGTEPFYYSASTGDYIITYQNSWTLTGLSAGDYSFLVTDSAFCNFQTSVSLFAAQGISSVDITVQNSNCSNADGSISIQIVGGDAPYTYKLIYPNGNLVSYTNNRQTYAFSNLSSGEYTVIVQDSNGVSYTENVIIISNAKFNLDIIASGATCNEDNGSVEVNVTFPSNSSQSCTNNFNVFLKDILSATGNTEPTSNDKVWVEYLNCENELITETFTSPNVYQICSIGTCYSTTLLGCYTDNLCCQWRVFNESDDTRSYTYNNCDGEEITISVESNEYSQTFCAISPPSDILLLTVEHIGPCSDCSCYDAITNGVYQYYDCNNILREGDSIGETICLNIYRPFSGVVIYEESVDCECGVPFIYIWKDNERRYLPEGYIVPNNEECCVDESPSLPLTYSLDNGTEIISNTFSTTVNFTNLSGGQHIVSVTDSTGCKITQSFVITSSVGLDFTLLSASCGDGNDGTISVIINSGEPEFEYQWSSNVPGNPQTYFIENLSADTYTLTLTDANGCCSTRQTTISCYQELNGNLSYIMGEDIFETTEVSKCSILKIFNDGYQEIVEPNCDLDYAEFFAEVTVIPDGYTNQSLFYTSYSLTSVPTDQQWADILVSLIFTIPGVMNVTADLDTNQILVTTIPGTTNLNGQEIQIKLIIEYYLDCEE